MATLKNQIRVLNSALPVQVRSVFSQITDLVPDIQLPAIAPTISRGNSFILSLPGLGGRSATRINVPTPSDAIKGVESVLPTGVPRLSQALGFAPAPPPTNGNAAPMVGEAQDRQRTTFRATRPGSSSVGAGGYRFS